jgi:hypothetical protein
MRTSFDPQAVTWLAAQLRWERLLDELRRTAAEPGPAPVAAVERPRAA